MYLCITNAKAKHNYINVSRWSYEKNIKVNNYNIFNSYVKK